MTERTGKDQVLCSALVESFGDGERRKSYKGGCDASVWITMEDHWSYMDTLSEVQWKWQNMNKKTWSINFVSFTSHNEVANFRN